MCSLRSITSLYFASSLVEGKVHMLGDCVVWHWDGFIAWGSRAGAAQLRVESHHLKSELLREEEDNPHTPWTGSI